MTGVDWVFVAIVVISTLFSIRRGFVREALSLVTWASAIAVAYLFSAHLATLLADYIETPSMRLILAVLILITSTLIVGAMVNHLIADFVRLTGLTGPDRTFGIVFGAVRGFFIVLALVLAAGHESMPFPQDEWWKESYLIPRIQETGRLLYSMYRSL